MVPPETFRLRFRRWRPDDLPLAIALWGDPQVSALFGGPFDAAAAEARLAEQMALADSDGVQYWPMFLRRDGEHVGCCGLRPRDRSRGVLEIGFHLRPPYWGQGLAREAALAVIDHAFDRVGASGLFAGHHPQNDASRALLIRLGFRYTHDELFPPTGEHHRCYLLPRPVTE